VDQRCPGCIARSCAAIVVVLPWVAVEVDLPLDLEVVIPLESLMVLRLQLLDLRFPTI
jgi:hypothetical protein